MHLFNGSPAFNLRCLTDEQANKEIIVALLADDRELQFIKVSPAPAQAQ